MRIAYLIPHHQATSIVPHDVSLSMNYFVRRGVRKHVKFGDVTTTGNPLSHACGGYLIEQSGGDITKGNNTRGPHSGINRHRHPVSTRIHKR
jgi:hypothetical protein